MTTYILYGSKLSLAEAKEILEQILTLQFEARDSDYQGGEYFHAGSMTGEDFELKKNIDLYDGDPLEMNFSEFPTLLYINDTSRPEVLIKLVGPDYGVFTLLRNEKF
jgi:hypothetical protein